MKNMTCTLPLNLCLCLLLLMGIVFSINTYAGAYIFASDANGLDSITHPTGYTGTGGVLTLTVGIDPAATKTTELVTSIKNNINIWNQLQRTTGNIISGGSNSIASNQIDFESVALHEMGHCLGLAHVNLASESGLSGSLQEYTKTTDGADNIFNLDDGADNVIGSSDDLRGDDANLFWFKKADNDPFAALPATIDSTTYSRNLADLPSGHSFAVNGDRAISTLLGYSYSEAIMQQGSYSDEEQRTLTADGIATIKLAQAGKDEIQGNSDDYTINLQYAGITNSADLVVHFQDIGDGLAYCSTGGAFLSGSDHIRITTANLYFDDNSYNWFFNTVSNEVGGCSASAVTIGNTSYTTDTTQQSEISITANGTINIPSGINVVYQAPIITLNSGFTAQSGSSFTATATTVNCAAEVAVKSITEQKSTAQIQTQSKKAKTTQVSYANTSTLEAKWIAKEDIPFALAKQIGENQINEVQTDANGDYIIFSSSAQLLSEDTNSYSDVYFYHLPSNTLSIASTANNESANGASMKARINGLGKYIVYSSEASNLSLDINDSNQVEDIYLYNINKAKNFRVSAKIDGSQTQYPSSNPDIANEYPYVVYDKKEANQQHVYSVDIDQSNTILATKLSKDYNAEGELLDNSQPSISAEGRYISYITKSKKTGECSINIIDLQTDESSTFECSK